MPGNNYLYPLCFLKPRNLSASCNEAIFTYVLCLYITSIAKPVFIAIRVTGIILLQG